MSDLIRELLERPRWPDGLEVNRVFERGGDDGDDLGVRVVIGQDGDAYVSLTAGLDAARFCTKQGGGRSPRVRAALLILARAIQLDNGEG